MICKLLWDKNVEKLEGYSKNYALYSFPILNRLKVSICNKNNLRKK